MDSDSLPNIKVKYTDNNLASDTEGRDRRLRQGRHAKRVCVGVFSSLGYICTLMS